MKTMISLNYASLNQFNCSEKSILNTQLQYITPTLSLSDDAGIIEQIPQCHAFTSVLGGFYRAAKIAFIIFPCLIPLEFLGDTQC